MTQQELIQYIGNEEIANRLVKILGNPDLAKSAYDELEKSKEAESKESTLRPGTPTPNEELHDYTGVTNPPEWMFLYKGYTVDFKGGKVYVNGDIIPITFTEFVPFEAIIRATLEYIDNKESEEKNSSTVINHDNNLKDTDMFTLNVELDGKKVSVCPKSGAVTIDGKDAGFKVDPKKAMLDVFAEIANKMGVKNEPKKGTISLHDALEEVKEKLESAPVEVKASFNNIVKHLDEKKGSAEPKEKKTPEEPKAEPEKSKEKKETPKEEPKAEPEKAN